MGEASREIMRRARRQVPEWTPTQVQEALAEQHEAKRDQQDIVLVDVREKNEWNEGYIPGAIHVPRGFLELQIEEAVPDKSKTVVLYCAGGVRSLIAGKTLQEMGYGKAISMSGGFGGWKGQGYPFVQPRTLNDAQAKRYSRHLLVPEVGEQGQIKLLDSRVLLIGAGGLGSPAAYYLAAAGVGILGIIDADVVDESNLQRQILHNTKRIGQYKAESARETIEALNPDVKVVTHIERLDESNVARIIADYDVIVDGTDNFPTRYLLNDAGELHLAANAHPAATAHAGAIHHDGVEAHQGLDPEFFGHLAAELHHGHRADAHRQLDVLIFLQGFPQLVGDEAFMTVSAVIGADHHLIGGRFHPIFHDEQVFAAGADHGIDEVAGLLQAAGDGVQHGNAGTAADADHLADVFQVSGLPQGADDVQIALADLQGLE